MVVNLIQGERKKEKQYAIAYVDLLGTTDRIRTDNNSESLNILYLIYQYAIQYSENEAFSKLKYRKIETKIFSDNIVFAIPLDSDEPVKDICCLLEFTALFQNFASVIYHWLIRGGITVGSLFIDKMMVWGKGLVRAYKLESEIAYYPRIVVDSNIVDEYKIAQNDHFTIKDTDGQYYLNFVQYCGQDGDDNFTTIAEESYHELLSTIRSSDGTYAEKPYQKLQWYKNYLKMWYLKNHPNERPLQLEDPPQ